MQSGIKKSILIVDDDKDILTFLSYNLRKEGYRIFTATDGEEAITQVKKIQPSLILLDVMMPVLDGIEACRLIRSMRLNEQPIIAMLTARSEEYSEIAGFEAGADDYINKPIRPRLLIKKIESLLRRNYNLTNTISQSKEHGISINREKYSASKDGHEISLPKKEFELMELFVSNTGKVFGRQQILSLLWDEDTIVGERTVDVHIRKLRERFGNEIIRTIKGVGYLMP
ncbi:MAG: response regulator transcription factor [Bacteroidota bacterium]|nr:response regulator transcription factor [Bacteroidota bacterium]